MAQMLQLSLPALGRTLLLVIIGVVFASSYLYPQLRRRWKTRRTPLMGGELGGHYKRRNAFLQDPMKFYFEGYQKHKNQAFRVTHYEGERIVLPGKALDELWNISEGILNKNKAYDQRVLRQYTGLPSGNPFLVHCIRSDLTRNLTRINHNLVSEVERTVDETIGTCKEWTAHPIYRTTLRIVAIVSGSVFVGPTVCRDESFIHDSIHFTENIMTSVHMLQRWPNWMRPFARFLNRERGQLKKSWEHLLSSKKLFVPIIQQRREEVASGKTNHNDMLSWMMAKQADWKQTDDEVAGSLVQLGVAATHNTSMTVTQTLYQLAIRPELVDEVREEVRSVIARFDGKLSPSALHELKILDSVMKEAQRLNPTTPSHFHRYVEKDITLKDGTFIPAGMTVEAIFAPPLFDPVLFPDPQTFDPYRFLKLRRGETPDPNNYGNKEQYTFSHATKENLAWGYGAHVCPGRYFANNEIKLILARMLLRYNIRMPGGIKEVMKPQRHGMGFTPDLRKPIEFKEVEDGY
ncbi:cytochrome p450 [Colletotrichum musicola]|uniref:Cytochrome p450 n=1 Tax=Colletotrichum musicola TaxID=2175873 RepID=A0A8H6J707_9PEZI|nr:cytochrome p450 [Colletotrichum musicola]